MPNPGPANDGARWGGRVGTTPPSRHYAVLRIFRLMVDGIVGPQFEATVKNLQRGAGLVVSATVDSLTSNALPAAVHAGLPMT
jgi:peptidoglycan hydrolase-like protein with peptidoglycan-binding domain